MHFVSSGPFPVDFSPVDRSYALEGSGRSSMGPMMGCFGGLIAWPAGMMVAIVAEWNLPEITFFSLGVLALAVAFGWLVGWTEKGLGTQAVHVDGVGFAGISWGEIRCIDDDLVEGIGRQPAVIVTLSESFVAFPMASHREAENTSIALRRHEAYRGTHALNASATSGSPPRRQTE